MYTVALAGSTIASVVARLPSAWLSAGRMPEVSSPAAAGPAQFSSSSVRAPFHPRLQALQAALAALSALGGGGGGGGGGPPPPPPPHTHTYTHTLVQDVG